MSRFSARAAVQLTTGRIIRQISSAIAVISFSPFEEEFFREGEKIDRKHHEAHDAKHHDDFSDLDHGVPRPSVWRALVGWLRGERTRHE